MRFDNHNMKPFNVYLGFNCLLYCWVTKLKIVTYIMECITIGYTVRTDVLGSLHMLLTLYKHLRVNLSRISIICKYLLVASSQPHVELRLKTTSVNNTNSRHYPMFIFCYIVNAVAFAHQWDTKDKKKNRNSKLPKNLRFKCSWNPLRGNETQVRAMNPYTNGRKGIFCRVILHQASWLLI